MRDNRRHHLHSLRHSSLKTFGRVALFGAMAVSSIFAQDSSWTIDDYSVTHDDDTQFSGQTSTPFTVTNPAADNYDADLYERPISSGFDTYYASVDIKTTYIGLDNEWFYYAIELVGLDSGKLEGEYGFEVDFDSDNRGDFYFIVGDTDTSEIKGTSWTNKTVEAWEDANNNIGGSNPLLGNDPLPSQDGFETEREKEGSNVKARMGRTSGGARINTMVEIAVKQSFVGNPATAGNLRGWAMKGGQSLQNMSWNDEYSESELGGFGFSPRYIQNFLEGDNSGSADGSSGTGSGDPNPGLILIGIDVETQTSDQATTPDSTVDYTYRVQNSADGGTDVFNITATSSSGWRIELFDSTGTTLYATDSNGDGTWDAPLEVPAQDSDGNGDPDTGDSPELEGGPAYEFIDYVVRITIPDTASDGDSDTLTVTGTTVKVDGDNNTVSDTDSNLTTISQTAGVTLVENESADASPPATVVFPHVLTNTGNYIDSFTFSSSTSGSFAPDSIVIYSDLGTIGTLDGADLDITTSGTGNLNASEAMNILVLCTLAGDDLGSATVTITATSVFDSNVSASVEDSITTSADPSFTVVKSVRVDDGNLVSTDDFYIPGTDIIYSVVVTNSGLGSPDADSFIFTDELPDEVTLYVGDYVGGGGGPIDFGNGSPSSTLTYTFTNLASDTDSITFKNSSDTPITPDDSTNGGYADSVRSFEINAEGTFAPWSGSGSQPSITIEYRAKLK